MPPFSRFLRGAILVAGVLVTFPRAAPAQQQPAQQAPEPATFVITNASIVTMDPRYPRAEALAATGEWITAVGTVAEIQKLVGPRTRVLDARGRLVIPGF